MNTAYMSGQSSPNINYAINPDPRFMIWGDINVPAIFPSSQLAAWNINTTGSAHVDITRLYNDSGLTITATNSGTVILKSSLLNPDDLSNLLGKNVTLSVKLSEAISYMKLSLKQGDAIISEAAINKTSDFFMVNGTLANTYDSGEFKIEITINSPLIAKIEYVKLEIGSIATMCPIRSLEDELNTINSRYGNRITGILGKSKHRTDMTGLTINLNDYTLSDGYPEIFSAVCKTTAGSSNISNIPIADIAFTLDVNIIKWISPSDFVTRQTLINNKETVIYVRHCINNIWSDWSIIGKGDTIIELNKGEEMHFWVGTNEEYLLVKDSLDPSVVAIVMDVTVGGIHESIPASRKINGKALSSDIVLRMSDINAVDDTTGKLYRIGVNNGILYCEEITN